MSKLMKPVFYEDIDELVGGLLKKKKKKKITYAPSKYSTLKKITPQPAKLPKFRDISPYDPPAPRPVPVYFPPVPVGLKPRARKPEPGKRRTHAEQLADLGRDTEFKTLRGLTKFQQGIRRLLEGKPIEERRKIIAEEERRLKEQPTTEKLTSVSSKSRRKQIEQARKEGKLRPLPPLLPRAAEEKEGEYEDPPMLFPPVPPKLPSELALLEPVKKRGRPPKSPAEKAEAAAVKKEAAAVKKAEIAAAKREEGLKKSKSGSLDVIFGKVPPKVSPKASKVSPKAETLGELPTGFGKFKNQKRRKRK